MCSLILSCTDLGTENRTELDRNNCLSVKRVECKMCVWNECLTVYVCLCWISVLVCVSKCVAVFWMCVCLCPKTLVFIFLCYRVGCIEKNMLLSVGNSKVEIFKIGVSDLEIKNWLKFARLIALKIKRLLLRSISLIDIIIIITQTTTRQLEHA